MHDDELMAAIREVRERARARTPNGSLGLEGVTAADLMPLLHARDAAEAKVAAIGTVNPRRGGLKNSLVQAVKRLLARALDWHVREQVEFNRAVMACVQASLEALTDTSRGLAAVAAHHRQLAEEVAARDRQLREEVFTALEVYQRRAEELSAIGAECRGQLDDVRRHWAEWRVSFEERRAASEIHILRTVSELQASFQHRVTLLDQNFREMVRVQHSEFTGALASNTLDVQKRLWQDLEQVRAQYEKLIYTELRTLRQKPTVTPLTVAPAVLPPVAAPGALPIDWMRFSDVFRGSRERILEHQRRHAARFAAAVHENAVHEILDLGCGRGEFLEAARDAGLKARGIDLSEECVALCRSRQLAAERADLFEYLEALPDRSLGGVFCSQVVEHLAPERVPVLVALLAAKLHPGALAAIETPNPDCLAIFATHFYIDPTHTRPVPAALLRFYLEEAGFGNVEVERLEPAVESMPALADFPASIRDTFFGALDYAIFARKL